MRDLLKKHILEPLNMYDTDYCVPTSKQSKLMPMFGVKNISELSTINLPQTQDLTPVDVEDMYPSTKEDFVRGGHGLFSTLDDYAKFAQMLLTGQSTGGEVILSRKMLDMSKANRIPASQLPLKIGINPLPGYGWGLTGRVMMDVDQARSLTNPGEFGWAAAAGTYFWVDRAEDMIGVFMTQYLGSMLPLSDDMRSAAYQMLA